MQISLVKTFVLISSLIVVQIDGIQGEAAGYIPDNR